MRRVFFLYILFSVVVCCSCVAQRSILDAGDKMVKSKYYESEKVKDISTSHAIRRFVVTAHPEYKNVKSSVDGCDDGVCINIYPSFFVDKYLLVRVDQYLLQPMAIPEFYIMTVDRKKMYQVSSMGQEQLNTVIKQSLRWEEKDPQYWQLFFVDVFIPSMAGEKKANITYHESIDGVFFKGDEKKHEVMKDKYRNTIGPINIESNDDGVKITAWVSFNEDLEEWQIMVNKKNEKIDLIREMKEKDGVSEQFIL
jgi:hypothetical protein